MKNNSAQILAHRLLTTIAQSFSSKMFFPRAAAVFLFTLASAVGTVYLLWGSNNNLEILLGIKNLTKAFKGSQGSQGSQGNQLKKIKVKLGNITEKLNAHESDAREAHNMIKNNHGLLEERMRSWRTNYRVRGKGFILDNTWVILWKSI